MNMKTGALSLALLFFMSAGTVYGAGHEDLGQFMAASIPPHVTAAFNTFPSSKDFAFSARINPFYIQGDFNGDNKPDTAIFIRQKATGKAGFAIVHGGSEAVRVFGAGRSFGVGGDDFSWMDAWRIHGQAYVARRAGEGAPPKLAGDAITVIKTEAASALIYWDGTRYRWYQQGD